MTLLVGSFDVQKLVPDITYNVFVGTLNLAQSIASPLRQKQGQRSTVTRSTPYVHTTAGARLYEPTEP